MSAEASGSVELKACPFCNGMPEDCPQNSEQPHPKRKGEWCVYIWCDNCNARGPEKREVDEAIAAWNTRISRPAPSEEMVEQDWLGPKGKSRITSRINSEG